jgi:uncharacterized protein YjbI with pentapeptide repeats
MAPDLPELQLTDVSRVSAGGGLALDGALLEACAEPLVVERLELIESELRGIGLVSPGPLEVRLRDAVLRDCDLSNLAAREGAELTRVAVRDSRLIGIALTGARLRDVALADCMASLGSLAFAALRDVSFERVNLREASFMNARLEGVSFIDCQLEGADFRGATVKSSLMRGSSLESVIGVESLRGLTMAWNDVLASAAALAGAAGIEIEP